MENEFKKSAITALNVFLTSDTYQEEVIEHVFGKHINTARHPEDGSLLGQTEVLIAMQNAIEEAYICGVQRAVEFSIWSYDSPQDADLVTSESSFTKDKIENAIKTARKYYLDKKSTRDLV